MIINLGDAPFKAFIKVTYPNGTCTVSLGDKSFTHTGGGTHTFTVNKKGAWTVKATSNDGYNLTAQSTAALTYRGQVANVTLTYFDGYVYNAGDIYEEFTGGYSTVPLAADALEFSTNYDGKLRVRANYGNNNPCAALTNKAIDLTNYSRLRAIGDSNSNSVGTASTVGVSSTRSVGGGLSHYTNIGSSSTLDISGLSGPHYIGIWAPAYSGIAAVSKIWLE